jgi:CheY-like chemotaxis protein
LVRCIAAGCDEHVAKPVTKRGIVSAVRKHVGSLS